MKRLWYISRIQVRLFEKEALNYLFFLQKVNPYEVLPENNADVLTKFNSELSNMNFLNEMSAPMISKKNLIKAKNLSDIDYNTGSHMRNHSDLIGSSNSRSHNLRASALALPSEPRASNLVHESINQQNKLISSLLSTIESRNIQPKEDKSREKLELELKIRELEKTQHLKSEMYAMRLQMLMMSMKKEKRKEISVERLPPPPSTLI